MYETLVIGTDGSESAERAFEHALDTAETHGASLHAISVVNTRRYGEPALSSHELVLNELEDRAERQLQEIESRANARGVEVSTRSRHGEPSEEILNLADDVDADAIILGQRGRTHPKADIGSTAEHVVRNTDRLVQLV